MANGGMARIIRVFVSSPNDVEKERTELQRVVRRINDSDGVKHSVRLETWTWAKDAVPEIGPEPQAVIDGQLPRYDIYLGIMKHRFGTPAGPYGSGTEKEFRDAFERWGEFGDIRIVFYFSDEKVDFFGEDTDQLIKVKEFREELAKKGLYGKYRGLRRKDVGFSDQVDEHLRKIIGMLLEAEVKPAVVVGKSTARSAVEVADEPFVAPEYKGWMCKQCDELELMGARFKDGVTVRLNHVYTPLVTSGRGDREAWPAPGSPDELAATDRQEVRLLLELIDKQSLYVSGAPGSGKSTFCRWVTWLVCNGAMPAVDVPAPEGYSETFPEGLRKKLPVLVPLRSFWKSLPASDSIGFGGLESALENWLAEQKPEGLDWPCLQGHLRKGWTLLMLDGIDEVPTMDVEKGHEWYPRPALLGVLGDAIDRWARSGNRILVTSRPYGLDAEQQKKLGLAHAPIQGLDRQMQALLARRWFVRLNEGESRGLPEAEDMISHIRGMRGLDALAANPLLLTAMCVIYHEGKRLPGDKHELYNRIVDTVLYKRYPASERVEQIRGRLGAIALGMHTGDGLGQVRATPEAVASYHEIDLLLQKYRSRGGSTDQDLSDTVSTRENLLSESGLLVTRGADQAEFYHLTLQEFMAAERFFVSLGLKQREFREQVFKRAESAGWRNTLSFVFGSLVSKFNPDEGVILLQDVVGRLAPAMISGAGKGEDAWNQAIVLGDCLAILHNIKAVIPDDLREFFAQVALLAIEQEITVKDRHTLAVVLGCLGDARIVNDLRVRGDPAAHMGYVEIPAGKYVYGNKKEKWILEAPFHLTKYPVTNSQYDLFIVDGGYKERKFWSSEGWKWLKSARVEEPQYWRHPDYSAPNQPVVGVSYWEAEAFARWAGGTLPAERQWEAAARGPKGLEYPWGNGWKDGICNSREADLGSTSVVGIFPRSRSKDFGLEDMAGNVWEWCVDTYEEGPGRVFRGGSWGSLARDCRAAIRIWGGPDGWSSDLGFRVSPVPLGRASSGRAG